MCVRETREKFVPRTPSSTSSQPPPHIQHHDTKTPKHKQDSKTRQHVCPHNMSVLTTCLSFCVCALCLSFFHIIPPLTTCNTNNTRNTSIHATSPHSIHATPPHQNISNRAHGHGRKRCSMLQCVAVCCSVLQCLAVCCSVLQCVHINFLKWEQKESTGDRATRGAKR